MIPHIGVQVKRQAVLCSATICAKHPDYVDVTRGQPRIGIDNVVQERTKNRALQNIDECQETSPAHLYFVNCRISTLQLNE